MDKFTKELIKLTGVSYQYANSAWYTLTDYDRTKPVLAAAEYARRYKLSKQAD